MTTLTAPDLELQRYPVGRFSYPTCVSQADMRNWIRTLEELPASLRQAVKGLNEEQLDTAYRENGWTIRQVVHHIPESHMNAYIRFKLALTEDNPTIRPYMEDRWAALSDDKTAAVDVSLDLTDALHRRWVLLLNMMTPADFARTYYHPENKVTKPLSEILCLYEWHSRHHLAHITDLKKRKGW